MANFEKAQKIVGINEGGYQSNPADSGNYYNGVLIGTNWGISAPVLAEFLKRVPTVEDMKNLKKEIAVQILKVNYWLKNNLQELKNQSVANLIYDGCVNHGNNGMRYILRDALAKFRSPYAYYEVFTKSGINFMNKLNQYKFFMAVKQARALAYKQSKNTGFIKSWLKRLDRLQYYDENTLSSIFPVSALGLLAVIFILIVW